MALYTADSIERLREGVDIVAVISRKTDLRRVGTRYTGLCPFHDERTPSFSVDNERGLYHCFGCGEGGDAIKFVMETENLDFPSAVEQLAEEFRIELKREKEDPQEEERRKRRERLLALVERTASFYRAYFERSAEASRAREYLAERGLGDEVLASFRVGYAPSAWDRVLLSARKDGYSEEELVAAGLAVRNRNGGVYDRFRERITFPLADARGRVLGFGARAMRDEQGAKYINSAEGELYHKGRLLFGIDRARAAVSKAGRVLVVEGYTDVLALHQAGLPETVGIMGTAFTSEQMRELARVVGDDGTVFLALDADRSGQEAMLRAAQMATERGVSLRVVRLPEGRDPADLVAAEGSDAVHKGIASAVSVLEFSVGRVLADGELHNPEGRDRALNAARELIATAPPRSAMRSHLVGLVSDRLDVPVSYVETGDAPVTARPIDGIAPVVASKPLPNLAAGGGPERTEIAHLALCLAAGSAGREELERLDDDHFSLDVVRRAASHLAQHFDDPAAALTPGDAEFASVVLEAARRADDSGKVTPLALRKNAVILDLRRVERQLRRANSNADTDSVGRLNAERRRLQSEKREAMGNPS